MNEHRTRTNMATPAPDYDDVGLYASSRHTPRRLRDAALDAGSAQAGDDSRTDWDAAVAYQVNAEAAARNGDHTTAATCAALASARAQLAIVAGIARLVQLGEFTDPVEQLARPVNGWIDPDDTEHTP